MVRAVGGGGQLDGFEKVLDAGGGVTFAEEFRAFYESLAGFAGQGKVLDGDDGIVLRSLRSCRSRDRDKHCGEEQSGWFHAHHLGVFGFSVRGDGNPETLSSGIVRDWIAGRRCRRAGWTKGQVGNSTRQARMI